MIFSVGKGRAGNLMFQLGAIESVLRKPRERIYLINFFNLEDLFPSLKKHVHLITLPKPIDKVFHWIDSGLRRLAQWRVIGSVVQDVSHPTAVSRHRGVLPLTWFWGGFCQDEDLMSVSLLTTLYATDIARLARASNDYSQELGQRSGRRCFVHVRRGDYSSFPSPEHPALLPRDWFLAQMRAVQDELKEVHFAVLSDEPQWAHEHLGGFPNTRVLDLNPRDSFALMSASQAGILSPSSFSWWAAYFASRNSAGPYIAPDLWTGWRLGNWDPHEKIAASFLRFVPVESQ